MKRSYLKMLMFQFIVLVILFLNSFVSNILEGYKLIIFLLLALVTVKFLFGFERDRHRYTKDLLFDVFIFLLIFFILYYLSGIFIGFARISNYYTFDGLKNFILPTVLYIIIKEFLRYAMLVKTPEHKLITAFTTIVFIFLDLTDAIYYNSFKTSYDVFMFIALSLLPAISVNIVASYCTKKVGYKPIILYLLITELYLYLLPIVPNPNEYIASLVRFLLPILLGYRVYLFFEKESDEFIEREYKKRSIFAYVIPVFFMSVIIYFTSGYFKYYSLAIASGSMEPSIRKGDIVIVEKIDNNFNELEEGRVIAFKYNSVVVVHRIIKVVKDEDQYYFYTKGDANPTPDNYKIEENMIIGTVDYTIPYIGLPTVWLNE